VRGGGSNSSEVVFRTSGLLGDVGTETGMSTGALSMHTNWRDAENATTLADVLACVRQKDSLAPFQVYMRTVLQAQQPYAAVRKTVIDGRVCAPVMVIMAGTKPSEGSIVIKRDSHSTVRTLDCAARAPWHVEISTRDWDVEPADPRHKQVEKAFDALGPAKSGTPDAVFKIFSNAPTFSNHTILTAIMAPFTNTMDLYLR
jgi:hypothetical protein